MANGKLDPPGGLPQCAAQMAKLDIEKDRRHAVPRFSPSFLGTLCSFVLLLAALALVYQPSFDHTPKRDQLYYLLEISRVDGFGEILEKSFSYNRTRTVEPSDTQLFRPGLFLLLAVQSFLFDYHFEYFRWVSLVLHTIVCLLLLRLLKVLFSVSGAGDWTGPWASLGWPLVGTLMFAFNPAIAEVVSWEHIQGYLVFTGLILAALDLCVRFERDEGGSRRILAIWSLLLISVFFHEAGNLFAPCFGLFLAVPRSPAWSWRRSLSIFFGFLLVPFLYGSISVWDYFQHAPAMVREAGGLELLADSTVAGTLYNGLRFFVFCCVQPLVPFALKPEHSPGQFFLMLDLFSTRGGATASNLALRGVMLAASVAGLTLAGWLAWSQFRVRRYFPILIGLLLAFYMSLYVLLRMNVRSDVSSNFLGLNPQYVYFCLAISLSLFFQGFVMIAGRLQVQARRRLVRWSGVYFVLMASFSAGQTWWLNRASAEIYASVREEIWLPGRTALDRVRASGKTRVAFLFEDPRLMAIHCRFGVLLTTFFFGRHEVEDKVEAYISLPSGNVIFPGDPSHREAMEACDARPFYVKTLSYEVVTLPFDRGRLDFRSSFAIYKEGGGWMGNLSLYPYLPAPLAKNLPFSVQGKTLKEIVAASAKSAEQAQTAVRQGKVLLGVLGAPLLHERYRNRILAQALGRFYALPVGPFTKEDLEAIYDEKKPGFPSAATLAELRRKIDEFDRPH